MIKSKLVLSLFTAGVLYGMPLMINDIAGIAKANAAEPTKRESKRVPAMRNRVYSQLARAQELADAGDKIAGFEVLDEVSDRIEQLNSYEKAMMWNFYGFMYYGNDDIDNAIDAFEQVIAQEAIPDSLYLSTIYSLAQLAMQTQDYAKALGFLKQWQANSDKELQPGQHIMFAQVYYQDKKFNDALTHINSAIELAQTNNEIPKENWLILQRAAYYELKQPEKVTQVMEMLVKLYQKPEYWLQLAGMYGEIGEEKKQLGAMETAWQAGFVTKESDIVMLAQLYLFNQLPYKAAKLLDDAIAKGVVVADEKRIQLMAQAYVMAKEDEKAIPVLHKGAEIAENGKFDEQLAQAYLNTEKWQDAITSANTAIKRGALENEGNMHLALGMSYFNLGDYHQAITAFKQAQKFEKVAKTAKQWATYVAKERDHKLRLAMN
ncbi:tetratricopeptide repeat protein [Thalassotalea sp. M1531]|uniref:Tetratricopeptide repeat protein n=1 Tax=Thalassotalea algicola TaxID=2716224 RepID=A0A7Y0Q834_9GAMM|nr:CDC27 family protein [Thalassotalea algicola]NMP32826.1 tetratricopeptide repeat protein [Thalassotalea algicola]